MQPTLPLLAAVLLAACSAMPSPSETSVSVRPFGVDHTGQPATLWTLRSDRLEVDVTDHGATLVAVRAPDAAGSLVDVILGFDDVQGYESADNQYFGCTTGRVCNRIAKGEFTLDGYRYRLAINNGPNHLHGGAVRSFDKVHWNAEVTARGRAPEIRFTYLSRDGEEGYPGDLQVAVTYRLDAEGLHITYDATTAARTPVNITNHAYWNLAGQGASTVLDHELWIDAGEYTPTDATLIPTGEIAAVPLGLDFRQPRAIGMFVGDFDGTGALGYDHNYVLAPGTGVRKVASLRYPPTGRAIEVWTDQPGLQFYSGNFLHGQRGKGGKSYAHRSAICLETQHFPDSVNHANFPSTILEPGQAYHTTTVIRFAFR